MPLVSVEMVSENGKSIVFGDFNETWRYERKIAHAALRYGLSKLGI